MNMTWFAVFPLIFGFLTAYNTVVRGLNELPTFESELLTIAWFILAVLTYGVFK